MRIKAVDDIEEFCELGSLRGQICGTAAAKDQDVNLVGPQGDIADADNGNAFCLDGN